MFVKDVCNSKEDCEVAAFQVSLSLSLLFGHNPDDFADTNQEFFTACIQHDMIRFDVCYTAVDSSAGRLQHYIVADIGFQCIDYARVDQSYRQRMMMPMTP